MASHAFSVHAHFYQPPREDPLTGIIPGESGASPFSNWNERIHDECYRPNAELKNFEQVSFDIGPTLSAWMQAYDPDTHQKIVDQENANLRRNGVGNGMAQAYNHTILPLSPYRDKFTQVYWGLADFVYRYGHRPQGMWLPETAADFETLEVLAQHGIEFTILAPWQAESEEVDPSEPYMVKLPNNLGLTVFFYQGDLSGRISFDPGATSNADEFTRYTLHSSFSSSKNARGEAQLLVIASDGELYGHHQRWREQFLARLVNGASSQLDLQATYPALWLRSHPATQTIKVRERTSWSCHHGVGRWTGQCSCTPGDGIWKVQLRRAFDRLGEELDRLYLDVARPLTRNPWLLRDRYIHVHLKEMTIDELFGEMTHRTLTSEQKKRLHLMLEAQRERQRMFTSCGWYFEDFDRIEPRNNVAYAAQAVRLAHLATGENLEASTANDLEGVFSQRSPLRASQIFQHHLRRAEEFKSVQIGYAD